MAEEFQFVTRVMDRHFAFRIYHKLERLGAVPVRHLWMDVRDVYKPGLKTTDESDIVLPSLDPLGPVAVDRRAVADFYWAKAREYGLADLRHVRESYLLTRLVPSVRLKGAGRIVPDGRFQPKRRAVNGVGSNTLGNLEEILRRSRHQEIGLAEFYSRSAQALGMPEFTEKDRVLYQQVVAELLDEGCNSLDQCAETAVNLTRTRWRTLDQKWGRRGGCTEQKRILNCISYDAKAALNRCYAGTWAEIMPELAGHLDLDVPTLNFLRLWHQGHLLPSGGKESACDYFHGHIFALHPALSMLIQVQTGKELLGDYVSNEAAANGGRAFRRVLNAVLTTLYVYKGRREDVANDRKKAPKAEDSGRIDDYGEQGDDQEDDDPEDVAA